MQAIKSRKLTKKRIAVSEKRQITIPIEFFNQLGIEREVECYVQDGSLIIRRASLESNGEFSEQILADLIAQGLHGDELMTRFRDMNRAIRPAVKVLIAEADKAAAKKAELASMSDVFGSESD